MKKRLVLGVVMTALLIVISSGFTVGKHATLTDTLLVRVHNNSHYRIKAYVMTVGGKGYTFKNIPPNSYSSYQLLPYFSYPFTNAVHIARPTTKSTEHVLVSINEPVEGPQEEINNGPITIELSAFITDGRLYANSKTEQISELSNPRK